MVNDVSLVGDLTDEFKLVDYASLIVVNTPIGKFTSDCSNYQKFFRSLFRVSSRRRNNAVIRLGSVT